MSAIGLRVGPFEIRDEVTVPGAGTWYRAHRTGLTRRQPAEVLIRLLGPAPSSRDLAAVQRQFDVLRAVDDRRFPSAVALYEGSGALAVDAPVAAPLSPLVEARLLGDVTLTPATLLDVALELTEALSQAHQKGHHHGHLSADTVALAPDGGIWVWGLGNEEARPAFAWLPPERARGESTSALTDQWSLGALFVALITGRTPWSPSSAEADPRSGDLDRFIDPVTRQWPALGRLCRRMLDPNPSLRFPTLHPVRLELLALARRAGGTSDRKALATWLHRSFAEQDLALEELPASDLQIAEPEDDDLIVEAPPAAAPVQAPTLASVAATAPTSGPTTDPDMPRIDDARRTEASPRPWGRSAVHRHEDLSLVHPEASTEDVPLAVVAAEPPPIRARAVAAVTFELDDADGTEMIDQAATEMVEDRAPTEMAEDWMPTEMVQVAPAAPSLPTFKLQDPSTPPLRVQAASFMDDDLDASDTDRPTPPRSAAPISIQLRSESPAAEPENAPVSLKVGPAPDWADEPSPTLPGMDAPEPAALRATPVPVQFTFDDEEDDDPGSAPRFDIDVAAALAVEVEFIDDEDPPSSPQFAATGGASPTVVPFTDPLFTGPSLGLELRTTDAPDPSVPEFVLQSGTAPMPWERDVPMVFPEPSSDPVVRFAPWVGSVGVLTLALFTAVNVLL